MNIRHDFNDKAFDAEWAAIPFAPFERPLVLTLPGLDNSCERHWQSHWEVLPWVERVEFGGWDAPLLHDWLPALDQAVRTAPRPVILVGHSLGSVAAAWWATLAWDASLEGKVAGALLVAPADVDAEDCEPRIRDFRPMPMRPLPFPALVVASRDDPHARFERSAAMATAWGAELVDAGRAGHINARSGLGEWSAGLALLARLMEANPALVQAELGLRKAFA